MHAVLLGVLLIGEWWASTLPGVGEGALWGVSAIAWLWLSVASAMYVVGFAMVWAPGFLAESTAGLLAAAFMHAYIWVHYWCTERPDMVRIYAQTPAQ